MSGKKLTLLFVFSLFASMIFASGFMDNLQQYEPQEPPGTSGARGQAAVDESEERDFTASLQSGTTGYVRVSSTLNVRDAPYGNRIGALSNNDEVNIIGSQGDWYVINYEGERAYVHSNHVSASRAAQPPPSRDDGPGETSDPEAPSARASGERLRSGSRQRHIAQTARELAYEYSQRPFPFCCCVDGGNLGCAQVVTHALVNADKYPDVSICGNPDRIRVASVSERLGRLGWDRIDDVPPFLEGDVIVWSAPPGGGHKHIGIATGSGNNVVAMHNSSSRPGPIFQDASYRTVGYVRRLPS